MSTPTPEAPVAAIPDSAICVPPELVIALHMYCESEEGKIAILNTMGKFHTDLAEAGNTDAAAKLSDIANGFQAERYTIIEAVIEAQKVLGGDKRAAVAFAFGATGATDEMEGGGIGSTIGKYFFGGLAGAQLAAMVVCAIPAVAVLGCIAGAGMVSAVAVSAPFYATYKTCKALSKMMKGGASPADVAVVTKATAACAQDMEIFATRVFKNGVRVDADEITRAQFKDLNLQGLAWLDARRNIVGPNGRKYVLIGGAKSVAKKPAAKKPAAKKPAAKKPAAKKPAAKKPAVKK